MGNFITIIQAIQTFNSSFDDGDNLSKFFGLLVQFNQGKRIDLKLKSDIEDFFDYKWTMDKN